MNELPKNENTQKGDQWTIQPTKSEALEREIERLYKFIADEEAAIERHKKNIYWDKKRLKVAKAELAELKES